MPRALLLTCALAACMHARAVETPAQLEATLRAQTQALLDGVTAGDPTVWERYVDPRASYVTEDGAIETTASLLEQITPLPKGISGQLVVGKLTVERFGDTAIAVHLDKEHVDYFGHALDVEYLTTNTWRRGPDGWRLIGTQVHAKLVDPPAIELPSARLDEYAGTYRLNADVTYTIRRDGGALVGERDGRPPQRLSVEASDVMFVAGQPRSRKMFQRDAAGRITGFADRREGHDVAWRRE